MYFYSNKQAGIEDYIKYYLLCCRSVTRAKEKENANEREYKQIKSEAFLCSVPKAHNTNICVYLRLFAFSFSSDFDFDFRQ